LLPSATPGCPGLSTRRRCRGSRTRPPTARSAADIQTHRLAFSDDCAYLEGSCAGVDGQADRVPYCIAYDLIGSQIASMRWYGVVGPFHALAVTPEQGI